MPLEFGIGAGNFAGRTARDLALAIYLASSHFTIGPPAVGNPVTWGLPCVAGGLDGPIGNLGRFPVKFAHLEGEIEGFEAPHAPMVSP